MTHIAGHIQNSFLRRGKKFPKHAGVLRPVLENEMQITVKKKMPKGILDYPIIFFNNRGTKLKYGQKIYFHPLLVKVSGVTTGFVCAMNVISEGEYKIANSPTTTALTKAAAAIKKSIIDDETEYRKTDSYKEIYLSPPIGMASSAKKSKKVRLTNDGVIKWIVNNAVPFDDMNLATN